jgi:hypothetical protein
MKPLVDRLRDPTYLTPWLLRNETADAIEKLEAENSEWAAKSIERESHLAIANAENERLRAALQEIATIDVGAGNMVRPLSRTDFMVAFGTARQVACEAPGCIEKRIAGSDYCALHELPVLTPGPLWAEWKRIAEKLT